MANNMTKEKLIKSLKNVKVVLGNGADLYCGLKTRYSDYFNKSKNYFLRIKALFEEFKKQYDTNTNLNDLSFYLQSSFGYNPKLVRNIWDVLFCLSFFENENSVLWCDIELKMHNSFIKNNLSNETDYIFSSIHWDKVNELVHNFKFVSSCTKEELFVAMISNIICQSKNDNGYYNFYSFLKDELIRFEYEFGLFISDATAYNPLIEQKQKNLLDSLVDINQITSIDTFNYSDFYGSPKNIFVKHINGTYKCPIFGIDRSFREYERNLLSSEALNYLKTSRRLDLTLIQNDIAEQKEYNNVIVFGHSLNKQDYSYFYPLLDKIKISDTTNNSHFVVAFTIYNESIAETIRSNVKRAVTDLINTYEKEHLGSHDARLLDYLTTQDRIILYQI